MKFINNLYRWHLFSFTDGDMSRKTAALDKITKFEFQNVGTSQDMTSASLIFGKGKVCFV